MRQYVGIASHALPEPDAPDFSLRLRQMLATIDLWARDASFGFGRIEQGEAPSGSGAAIGGATDHGALTGLEDDDHAQYLLLAGRSGGQTVLGTSVASDPILTIGAVSPWAASLAISTNGVSDIELMCTGSDPNLTLRAGASGNPAIMNMFVNAGVPSFDINAKLGIGSVSNNAALMVDSTGLTTSTTDANDNFRIYERSATQTGHAIRVMNSTASSTLFLVRADGHHYSTAGASNLTAQTSSIGSTTLLTGTASTAGMYRVSFYLKTTTAGNALDVVKVTLAWGDGTAQTLDVPLVNNTAIFNNHDLATLNAFSQGTLVVNAAASQNITFTTTVTKTGSPQYEIHARIEALG